jgi:hypothetical protein
VYWEKRKLTRSDRAEAYAALLDAWSRRQRAFQQRDVATKRDDRVVADEANQLVDSTREELWLAYCRVQVLAPQEVVNAAFDCVKISDRRNHAFKNPAKNQGVGRDEQAHTAASFVAAARQDMGLKVLDVSALRGNANPQLG